MIHPHCQGRMARLLSPNPPVCVVSWLSAPMEANFNILVWNVRGLNRVAHRNIVEEAGLDSKPSIICLQETKLAVITISIVMQMLGSNYDFFFLPAIGTRGVLVAWDTSVISASNCSIYDFSVIAFVTLHSSNTSWWLTSVYGLFRDEEKQTFLQELCDIRAHCPGPWLLVGDYNLIYAAEDKNNTNLNRRLMGKFCRFVDDLELKELHLHGRKFTWSNER